MGESNRILREITAKQRPGEMRRRWFYSRDFELIVWIDDDGCIAEFQLAYDKTAVPHALTWSFPDSFQHTGVDTGETHPLKPKASPILVADGAFEPNRIAEAFRAASVEIPREFAELVEAKIREFAVHQADRA